MLDNLRKTLLPQWLQFQQQINVNQRLRWMLWGILYIFLIYFALSLGEWRAEKAQSINQLQRTATKLDQLESQTEWPQRWDAEKAASAQLAKRLWKAKTPGLAEADLQNYLRELINKHNGDGLHLRLAPTETVVLGGETIFKVSADVSASISSNQINELMRVMAQNPQVLLIERFDYSPQRSGQLNLLVIGYFSTAEESTSEVGDAAL